MLDRILKAVRLRYRRTKRFLRRWFFNIFLPGDYYFSHFGYCVCCENNVIFEAYTHWLRDSYLCLNCKCKPRERALMLTLNKNFPDWKSIHIHESSPGNRGGSINFKKYGKFYTPSQYYPDESFGILVNGIRNENLEEQTFEDATFDLVITQDVMEHIYQPEKAFKEIARTLKPGGAYVFTVPLVNKHNKTETWATRGENGEPFFLNTPEYHGNPIDAKGSPVTMHWGYDIVDFIKKSSGMESRIIAYYDKKYGIMGEYNEVIISYKEKIETSDS